MFRINEVVEFLEMTDIEYECDYPLERATSFHIGGPAKIAVFPSDSEEFADFADFAENCGFEYTVFGRGTNILVPDCGIDCAVLLKKLDKVEFCSDSVTCGAGVSLTSLAKQAGELGFSGLEFAYGIPGSVGGGAYMNAGAYGSSLSDCILSVNYYSPKFGFGAFDIDDCRYSYRHSAFMESDKIILTVTFKLTQGDKAEILANMQDIMQRRIDKQPLDKPSAGSVFKRPANDVYAGKLIEDCGLKGYRIGGAAVSEKHAGFIVNEGGASCKDVLELIAHIKDTVREKYGYELECEICMPGGQTP
jgi:UDP-N-acetylmuramate dehydrogenase